MTRRQRGFTLLEVLVALAVAGVGLGAVIKVAGGNAYNAQYLQEKTFAQWVAMNRISEVKLSNKFPAIGTEKGDVEMAGRTWYWTQESKAPPIPEPRIQSTVRQINVDVYGDEARKTSSLVTVTTYISLPPAATVP